MEKIFDSLENSNPRNSTPTYYEILGCGQNATVEQIITEYRTKALQCHPDKHPDDENAQRQFKELLEAKEILSDPIKRDKYDRWLNSDIFMSWKEWAKFTEKNQMVFHWSVPKSKPMIELADERGEEKREPQINDLEHFRMQKNTNDDILSRFRNYQI